MVYHQKEQFDSGWRLQTKQHPLRVLFCLVAVLPQSNRRVSVGSMRADSGVNEAPVGLQSRIVTEPAGEKRLLTAPLADAVLFGCVIVKRRTRSIAPAAAPCMRRTLRRDRTDGIICITPSIFSARSASRSATRRRADTGSTARCIIETARSGVGKTGSISRSIRAFCMTTTDGSGCIPASA